MASPGDAPLLLAVTLRLMVPIRTAFNTAIEGAPVSPSQYRMLARLKEGPTTASALAEWQAVTPPTATKVIDGLVERAWVERLRSDDDRRHVLVALTPAGEEAARRLEAAASAALEDVVARLRPEERALVRQALVALAVALPCEASAVAGSADGQTA